MIKFDERSLKNLNILIVGDVMLDRHIWGEVERISPEAPVPVVDVNRETSVPGGASNVANNVAGLGANAILLGIVGEDDYGRELKTLLEKNGIDVSGLMADKSRPTTVKTRVIAHNQQVVRIDREMRRPADKEIMERIFQFIKDISSSVDGVIIEDYGKGLISSELIRMIIDTFADKEIPVAVDPKTEHYDIYKGVSVMTPNHHEAGAMFGRKITDDRGLLEVGDGIMSDLGLKALAITLGKEGMALFNGEGAVYRVPTVAKEEYDVTGAGDTVIATLTAMLAAGYSYEDAAFVSNIAAGIVVETPGVVPVKISQLKERLKDEEPAISRMRG